MTNNKAKSQKPKAKSHTVNGKRPKALPLAAGKASEVGLSAALA
ncbi:hypothetical protein SODG_004368 [Sodalis praecaptivus]